MRKDDLVELEKKIMELVVKRRKLGGFDVNAEAVLLLAEWQLKLVGHLLDEMPRKK